jgi:hypothetical protein
MKHLVIGFFSHAFFIIACAQSVRSPLTSAYTSSGVYSIHFSDVFSAAANPVSLARINKPSAGIYAERKFMLKELAYYQAIAAIPSKKGGFSLSMQSSGNTLFNELQFGVGYGRKLSEKIDLGARINYYLIKVSGYGAAGVLNAEIGALWHVTDQLLIGMHVYNPIGGRFGKEAEEKLPSVYTSGIGYEVSEKVFLSTEIVKKEDIPVTVNIALQYKFIEQFFLKTGFAINGQFFAGAGLRWNKLQIDFVSSWHQQLGITPSILFIFGSHD